MMTKVSGNPCQNGHDYKNVLLTEDAKDYFPLTATLLSNIGR